MVPTSDPESVSCAEILKVLADDTRLAVVRGLMGGARHVFDLQDELAIGQSLLSHHLKVLRDAGLVESRRDGKAVLYSLSPELRRHRRGEALDLGCCKLTFK